MQYHRFHKKDTLSALSAKYGVPICMLIRANGGITRFRPGQQIRIPLWNFCAHPTHGLPACPMDGKE
ncbi:LysM peptidoglycan-binding domain-containing protein [Eubacteriales bacterium OttesenSCG-928-M02]|nr:LysM peptidoglycan-binding domain-containing protein [Eubacteriales bacterium OttesenSCG-928-M02]